MRVIKEIRDLSLVVSDWPPEALLFAKHYFSFLTSLILEWKTEIAQSPINNAKDFTLLNSIVGGLRIAAPLAGYHELVAELEYCHAMGFSRQGYCASCHKMAMLKCGKCQTIRYCSPECQKEHWKKHKPES